MRSSSGTPGRAGRLRVVSDGFQRPTPPAPAILSASPQASEADFWGPWFLVMAAAGFGCAALVGVPWSLSLLFVLAFLASLLGCTHPTFGALAVTCLVVLDALAADFLNSPLLGSPLPRITGGLWRYNTVGYGFVFLAVVHLPDLLKRRDAPTRLLLVFAAAVAVGLAWTPDLPFGLQVLLDVLAPFGLIATFTRVAHDDRCWYWIGIVGGTLAAGCGLLYFLNRGSIPFTNPNTFVFAPLTGLFAACVALGRASGSRYQIVLGGLAIVNAFWAFLSASRGGLLAAAVCVVYLIASVRGVRQRLAFVVCLVLVAAAIATAFGDLGQRSIDRVAILFDSTVRPRARTSGRSDLLIGAWEIFQRHPLGVGTGGFEATWATLGSVDAQRQFMHVGERFPAHSGWMKALAEEGVIGFTLLGAFVLSLAVTSWRQSASARSLGILTTAVVGMLLATSEFHMKGLFFLPAALVALLTLRPAGVDRLTRLWRPIRIVRRLEVDAP